MRVNSRGRVLSQVISRRSSLELSNESGKSDLSHASSEATIYMATTLFFYVLVSETDVWDPYLVSSDVNPWKARKLAFIPRQTIVGPTLYANTLMY